jgi:hypothetical protein
MPIKYRDAAHRFKWQLAETGEPIGFLVDIGGALWLQCCPLCGCAHCHATWKAGDVIKPACMGQDSRVWANWRLIWITKHAAAKEHRTVMLQAIVEPVEIEAEPTAEGEAA